MSGPRNHDDEYSDQHVEDAAVNAICTRLVENGRFRAVMADLTPEERELVEASLERHAARMRDRGGQGW